MNNPLMPSVHYDKHSGDSLLATTVQSVHAVIGYHVNPVIHSVYRSLFCNMI